MIAALLALAAGLQGGASAEGAWRRIEPGRALELPRDHGMHPDVRTEWWYATGELVSGARRFGWQLTIFRAGLESAAPEANASDLRARHVLAGHVVLVDVDAARTRRAERARRLDGRLAFARADDLHVALDDLELARTPDGVLHARGGNRAGGFALDLALAPSKPAVVHGADGVSRKGPEPGNASMYVSFTRLATSGTLVLDGARLDVTGESWFDHEWGTSQLGRGVVGWDWTGMRLDDGRELMLYRLRRADGTTTEQSAGTLVEKDGRARTLAHDEFTLLPSLVWKSARTGAAWPVRWRLAIPSLAIEADIAARVDDCEIDATASTGTVYWEGPALVTGSVGGTGYLELVGYAGSMEGRF